MSTTRRNRCKRKSRSRGASARRARHKSQQQINRVKKLETNIQSEPSSPAKVSKTKTTDEQLRGRPAGASKSSKSKTAEGCSDSSFNMNSEEERLQSLSALLERLTVQYDLKSSSNSSISETSGNSPLHAKITPKVVNNSTINEAAKPYTNGPSIDTSTNDDINLSQEEKQTLRKARKQAKKAKSVPSTKTPPAQPPQDESPASKTHESTKPEKSKADLKFERRLKQEAERAAKANKVSEKKAPPPSNEAKKDATVPKLPVVKKEKNRDAGSYKRIPLFGHLASPKIPQVLPPNEVIHPAMRAIGIQMKNGVIDGCNARVIGMVQAISAMIVDYETPLSCDLSRDLSDKLTINLNYLNSCRRLAEPMNNVIKFIKKKISDISPNLQEAVAKDELLSAIDDFVYQNIIIASEGLKIQAPGVVCDGDIILTYGFSSLFIDIIEKAKQSNNLNISVVVVDKSHNHSGAQMLPALSALGVTTYYRQLHDLTPILKKVTKVIIEAEAVALNGAIMGPCGLAGLILMASTYSVPIVALSHTYKFCNVDLTDSLVMNELGDTTDIVGGTSNVLPSINASGQDSNLNILRLIYDVTPAQLVNMLITEQGIFQCSIVPVIIERSFGEFLAHD